MCVDLVVLDSENGEQHESDRLKVQLLERPESADGLSRTDRLLRGRLDRHGASYLELRIRSCFGNRPDD